MTPFWVIGGIVLLQQRPFSEERGGISLKLKGAKRLFSPGVKAPTPKITRREGRGLGFLRWFLMGLCWRECACVGGRSTAARASENASTRPLKGQQWKVSYAHWLFPTLLIFLSSKNP